MSTYQKMVAKKMAMYYRTRNTKGRFESGRNTLLGVSKKEIPQKDLFWDLVRIEAKKEAVKLIKEIISKLK